MIKGTCMKTSRYSLRSRYPTSAHLTCATGTHVSAFFHSTFHQTVWYSNRNVMKTDRSIISHPVLFPPPFLLLLRFYAESDQPHFKTNTQGQYSTVSFLKGDWAHANTHTRQAKRQDGGRLHCLRQAINTDPVRERVCLSPHTPPPAVQTHTQTHAHTLRIRKPPKPFFDHARNSATAACLTLCPDQAQYEKKNNSEMW